MSKNNRVQLIGNVGNEPDVRYHDSGKVSCAFSLATNNAYRDKDGVLQKETIWHNVTCWDSYAKAIEEKVHKGTRMFIEGSLKYNDWTDRAGTRHNTAYVSMMEFEIIGTGSNNN